MEMEVLNFNQICRTCKQYSPQMRSVFEGFENPHQSPRIDEMLMAFASVQVGVYVLEFFISDQNIADFSDFFHSKKRVEWCPIFARNIESDYYRHVDCSDNGDC